MKFKNKPQELLEQAKNFMKKGDVSAYLKTLMSIQELNAKPIKVRSNS